MYPINKIAIKITEIARPDIYHNIKTYFIFKDLIKKGTKKKVKTNELKKQEKSLSKLSKNLEVRARNIFYGIGQTLSMTIEESIYNYELDLRPDREIQSWEIMNLCFLEYTHENKIVDAEIKKEITLNLIGFSVEL